MGQHVDVLVVGAGPTGLTAAVVLAASGASVRIVDRAGGPARESRALAVQARTLELWDKLGLADTAVGRGRVVEGFAAIVGGRRVRGGQTLGQFPALGAGQTPYPYLLVLPQRDTERLLLDRLDPRIAVEWATEAVAVVPGDAGVDVELRGGGAVEHLTASWVVGADGAGSLVRHELGLPFEGGTYEQDFFLADVALEWAFEHDRLHIVDTPGGIVLFIPMPGGDHGAPRYRVLGRVTEQMRRHDAIDVHDVQEAIDTTTGVRARVSDARWVTRYRLHHRMAPAMRVGRVLLAGDAAHIHSPVGGQGMNTGIGDAYNLAWKLALVVRGVARPHLLDTYEAERLPLARRLLRTTDAAFSVLASAGPSAGLVRRAAFSLVPWLLRPHPVGRRLFAGVSQTGVSYRSRVARAPGHGQWGLGRGQHGSVVHSRGRPEPGDRAPHARFTAGPLRGRSVLALHRGVGHHLMLLTAAGRATDLAAASAAEVLAGVDMPVSVHRIGPAETAILRAYGAGEPAMVLVRPDGHIAWRGPPDDVAALEDHLRRWYHVGGAPTGAASPG